MAGETAAPSDTAAPAITSPAASPAPGEPTEAPTALAFVEPPPSSELCTATANIWVYTSALSLLETDATPEARQSALADASEWIERTTLFPHRTAASRALLLEAFSDLRSVATSDFDSDWQAFQVSTDYANLLAAHAYEAERAAVVDFITDSCSDLSLVDLQRQANEHADALEAEFAAAPSSVVESDSLPGHSIFTHTSGRLIASFPSAWEYEDRPTAELVDLIASPDIDRLLAGDAIDGVRLQLVEAATEAEFRTALDDTMTATSCLRTNNLTDGDAIQINVTQTFECSDHAATTIGHYDLDRGAGLIIEATFDRLNPSRADLIRLASIADSALWS